MCSDLFPMPYYSAMCHDHNVIILVHMGLIRLCLFSFDSWSANGLFNGWFVKYVMIVHPNESASKLDQLNSHSPPAAAVPGMIVPDMRLFIMSVVSASTDCFWLLPVIGFVELLERFSVRHIHKLCNRLKHTRLVRHLI